MRSEIGPPLIGPLVDWITRESFDIAEHSHGESGTPTEEQAQKAITDMQQAFLEAFGQKAYEKAISDKKKD